MERVRIGDGLWICLFVSALLFGISSSAAGALVDTNQSLGESYGRSVSVGDLDGDCDLDAFVVNAYGDGHRVWRNNGSGAFSDTGQVLDSDPGFGGALGDLDGDGDLDAFVGYGTDTGSKVWFNNGSGTFSEGQELGGDIRHAVALGDLDGDGDLDALDCGTPSYTSDTCNSWRNNGSGVFSSLQGFSLSSGTANGIALGDLDGDNDLDVVIGVYSNISEIWLNNGSGTLTQDQIFDGGLRPQGVALGDCDDDGDLDAFIANQSSGHKVFLNDGSANLTDSGQTLGPLDVGKFRGVALGDLDCDGDLDAFVTGQDTDAPNLVFLNDGECNFTQAAWDLDSDNESFSVALGDLDGNGGLDAFVANMSSQGNRVYLNNQLCDYYPPCSQDAIPTLTEWGIALLVLFMAASAFWFIRRRKQLS